MVLSAVDGIALPSSALRADSAAGADSAAQQPPGPQPSAAPATAPPAAAAPDPFGHIHHQQQQQQGPPPPRLDAERAPVSAAREAVAQQGEGGGGGPAEGVTVWQYVSEGGESAVPIDSRASAEPGTAASCRLTPLGRLQPCCTFPCLFHLPARACKSFCCSMTGGLRWSNRQMEAMLPRKITGVGGVRQLSRCSIIIHQGQGDNASEPLTCPDAGSDAMLALPSPEAALERAFSDPLISPSHRPAPGSPTSPQVWLLRPARHH